MSQPLPVSGADVRIGLRIDTLELIVMRGSVLLDNYALEGRTDAMTGVWFDSALRALGLAFSRALSISPRNASQSISAFSSNSGSPSTVSFVRRSSASNSPAT